ncbi:hypothetical protein VNO80_23318 [Phaseolus coccineus]|uniref:Uncharacterized protein n=1 Tax=Phaseolus coccineus TaxID=3886 RepID=A0AAN9MC57_PHACN
MGVLGKAIEFQLWQSLRARECFEFGEACGGVMDWIRPAMMHMVLVMGGGGGAIWGSRVIRCGSDHGSKDESGGRGDESESKRKVKFLYSFGGNILPRPSDGMLRYVGGANKNR